MKTLFYTLVIVTLSALGASSLECIICNSVSDKNCGQGDDVDVKAYSRSCDTTDANFIKQLPTLPANETFKFCRKMVTNVDFDVNDNKAGQRVKRTCGYDDDEPKYNNDCYYRAGLGGRITVCSCQKDNCNGSNSLQVSMLLVPFVGILTIVSKWM